MSTSTPTVPNIPPARPRSSGTWGRLGVYLIGVSIGVVLLLTFKMMSRQQQQAQQAQNAAAASGASSAAPVGGAAKQP